MPGHELHAELAAVKRLQRRLTSASNRILWRKAVRKRATMISILLRRLPSVLLAENAELSRTPNGWSVSAVDDRRERHPVVELVTYTKAHSFDDLTHALPLRVLAQALVRQDRLEELVMTGMVALAVAEVT